MSDVILKIENLSKQYRLGTVGTGSISDDLKRWWFEVRGKEDPFLKIGDVNDRESKGDSDYVWALQNINFEVKRGEVLGIIGKNGAGKSTLLKILSKVTGPTTGAIKSNGRIASLLEVGTGFHPEMTGRENIYLNGAILGMTKKEIASKIGEIIAFSGCERYIDTPTKRYSSGMTVRLAFAVAAHLEPDILVVDEVLAVGDVEFQKKAIGKMKSISKEGGRTVLFVSHNMASVKNICTRALVLTNGTVSFDGGVDEGVSNYLTSNSTNLSTLKDRTDRKGNGKVLISDIYFKDGLGESVLNILSGESTKLILEYKKKHDFDAKNIFIGLTFYNNMGVKQTVIASDELGMEIDLNKPSGNIIVELPKVQFRAGDYSLTIYVAITNKSSNEKELLDFVEHAISFKIERGDYWNVGNVNRPDGFIQEANIIID